jgi:hypothetical protein
VVISFAVCTNFDFILAILFAGVWGGRIAHVWCVSKLLAFETLLDYLYYVGSTTL